MYISANFVFVLIGLKMVYSPNSLSHRGPGGVGKNALESSGSAFALPASVLTVFSLCKTRRKVNTLKELLLVSLCFHCRNCLPS